MLRMKSLEPRDEVGVPAVGVELLYYILEVFFLFPLPGAFPYPIM